MAVSVGNAWVARWSPGLPGTEYGRIEYLMKLVAIQTSLNVGSVTWEVKHAAVVLLNDGVLNNTHIAAIVGRSRAWVSYIRPNRRTAAPNGRWDPASLSLCLHLAQTLANGHVPDEVMYRLKEIGDNSIVSYLTGIPLHIIRRYNDDAEYRF